MVEIDDDYLEVISSYRKARFKFLSLSDDERWNQNKVSTFKRKAGKEGKIYRSPMIVLSSKYKKYVGKRYQTFQGRDMYQGGFVVGGKADRSQSPMEGDCIVLFFRDDRNKDKIR